MAEEHEDATSLAPPGGRRWRLPTRRLAATAGAAAVVVAATVAVTVVGWFGHPGGGGQGAGDRPAGGLAATVPRQPDGEPGVRTGGTDPLPGQADSGSGVPGPGGGPRSGGGGTGSGGAGGPGGSSGPTASGPPPSHPATVTPGTGPVFTAVAGPGCPQDASRSADLVGGWQEGSGGWGGDGCDGTRRGHRTTTTGGDAVTWRFAVPAAGICAVEVYVPAGGDATSAFYDVVSGAEVNGFTVDQAHNETRWVAAGRFPAAPGRFSVRLTDRGDGRTEVGAAALRVRCQ